MTPEQREQASALAQRLVADINDHVAAGMTLDSLEHINAEYRLAMALTAAEQQVAELRAERDRWRENDGILRRSLGRLIEGYDGQLTAERAHAARLRAALVEARDDFDCCEEAQEYQARIDAALEPQP